SRYPVIDDPAGGVKLPSIMEAMQFFFKQEVLTHGFLPNAAIIHLFWLRRRIELVPIEKHVGLEGRIVLDPLDTVFNGPGEFEESDFQGFQKAMAVSSFQGPH